MPDSGDSSHVPFGVLVSRWGAQSRTAAGSWRLDMESRRAQAGHHWSPGPASDLSQSDRAAWAPGKLSRSRLGSGSAALVQVDVACGVLGGRARGGEGAEGGRGWMGAGSGCTQDRPIAFPHGLRFADRTRDRCRSPAPIAHAPARRTGLPNRRLIRKTAASVPVVQGTAGQGRPDRETVCAVQRLSAGAAPSNWLRDEFTLHFWGFMQAPAGLLKADFAPLAGDRIRVPIRIGQDRSGKGRSPPTSSDRMYLTYFWGFFGLRMRFMLLWIFVVAAALCVTFHPVHATCYCF